MTIRIPELLDFRTTWAIAPQDGPRLNENSHPTTIKYCTPSNTSPQIRYRAGWQSRLIYSHFNSRNAIWNCDHPRPL